MIRSSRGYVVVVYHVTIVAIGHGLMKKFWPFGTTLRSTHCREFNCLKLCRPAYFIRTTIYRHNPGPQAVSQHQRSVRAHRALPLQPEQVQHHIQHSQTRRYFLVCYQLVPIPLFLQAPCYIITCYQFKKNVLK